ncbi:uncharacterized protein LOC108864112 [Galendromus occidentalis]|uniref:Uncharacterized protein LOC108864112 n=1 Tax=Galendromus occidentalis TaxID=34638 RepID=A0AAJ7P9J2_9ACAR|nr:uncharacterized protein LOC108864112 [Galendromus occidentalis]
MTKNSERPPAISSPETTATSSEQDGLYILNFEPDFGTVVFTGDPDLEYPPLPLPRYGSKGYSVFNERCRIPKHEALDVVYAENGAASTPGPAPRTCRTFLAEPFVFRRVPDGKRWCFRPDERVLKRFYPELALEEWNCSLKVTSEAGEVAGNGIYFKFGDCIEGLHSWISCTIPSSRLEYQEILSEPDLKVDLETGKPLSTENGAPLNVLLVEVSAMSRGDIVDQLPGFSELLGGLGHLVIFSAYHTMGENYLENHVRLVKGSSLEPGSVLGSSRGKSKILERGDVWESFRTAGYGTIEQPDEELLPGVKSTQGPRPSLWHLLEAPEEATMGDSLTCVKQELRSKYHFRNIIEALEELKQHERPLFSYSWFRNVSCAVVNETSFDSDLVEFLNNLNEDAALNDTAIFLISDSPSQAPGSPSLSSVENLLLGGLCWFPTRFAVEHPEKMGNLLVNSQNVIYAQDVHATLLDLIDLSDENRLEETLPGRSLFSGMAQDQTCQTELAAEYCACYERLPFDVESRLATSFAQAVIQKLNRLIPLEPIEGWELKRINEMVRFSEGGNWTNLFEISIRVGPSADIVAISTFSRPTLDWKISPRVRIIVDGDPRQFCAALDRWREFLIGEKRCLDFSVSRTMRAQTAPIGSVDPPR